MKLETISPNFLGVTLSPENSSPSSLETISPVDDFPGHHSVSSNRLLKTLRLASTGSKKRQQKIQALSPLTTLTRQFQPTRIKMTKLIIKMELYDRKG